MQTAENSTFIETIFSQKSEFEKHILNITCNSDRIDVMDILAKRLVRVLLKEELNFLYMKDLESFDFSLITNLLFREIASEWVTYAQETLSLKREDALEVLQEKKRVNFILNLVKEYFQQYKIYFAQEIADTFIELIENMPSPSLSNELINRVLKSDFVKSQNISVVYSYSQLWARVKKAHDAKKQKLTKIQIGIAEAQNTHELKKLEYKEEALEHKPLAYFDDALLRLRNVMVQYMMGITKFSN